MKYNWQLPDWPNFSYDISRSQEYLYQFAQNLGFIEGEFLHLPKVAKEDVLLQLMVNEALKTSQIEGEYLGRDDVMSSFKHQLGLPNTKMPRDIRALGIAKLITSSRETFAEQLSQKMLFSWHQQLLAYTEEYTKMIIGGWRKHSEPMQVVSSHVDKIIIHYEAPPFARVPKEMKTFIKWFNGTAPDKKKERLAAPIRAAIAHLYFESIHPFEDGNGRIGRVIAEKAISQSLNYALPMSISSCIEPKKKLYYAALKKAQLSNEITEWIIYFIEMLLESQKQAKEDIRFILQKTQFFDANKDKINNRQLKVLHRMLENGLDGFEGGITAKKYMNITRCSKATATRDLVDLLDKNILYRLPGFGRSTHYAVLFETT